MAITGTQLNAWTWVAFFVTWNVTAFFTYKTRWRESGLRRFHYSLLMAAGFTLIFHAMFSLRPRPAGARVWVGDAMTIAGIGFAAWARYHLGRYWSGHVTLKEGHKLIRTGPYRIARHPLYTGFLTAVLGSAVVGCTMESFAGFALVLIAVMIKIRREEKLMTGEFGEEYRRFRQETPALLPFIY